MRTATQCWHRVLGPYPARVGVNGLAATRHEGDGTTPIGTFAFGTTVYGTASDPGVRFHYHRLVCGDWWDEDPASRSYNRFRHIECHTTPPFAGKSEPLWLGGRAYTLFALIAYNTSPVVPGAGSAIFLHADKGSATNGCVSLRHEDLLTVLRALHPGARPAVAITVRTR